MCLPSIWSSPESWLMVVLLSVDFYSGFPQTVMKRRHAAKWTPHWQSLSKFACQQKDCGKIEMWIKAEAYLDCQKVPTSLLLAVFVFMVESCSIGENSSSPARSPIYRLPLTWPQVNTLLLNLYQLLSRSPSAHKPPPHTYTFLTCMILASQESRL